MVGRVAGKQNNEGFVRGSRCDRIVGGVEG